MPSSFLSLVVHFTDSVCFYLSLLHANYCKSLIPATKGPPFRIKDPYASILEDAEWQSPCCGPKRHGCGRVQSHFDAIPPSAFAQNCCRIWAGAESWAVHVVLHAESKISNSEYHMQHMTCLTCLTCLRASYLLHNSRSSCASRKS